MAWPLLCSLTSLALALRSRLPASPRMAAAPLVVPAAAFASELAYRTVTASTFAGAPLASHDAGTRGKVLTGYARRCDADEHPGAVIEDAVAGEDVNGRRLAQNQAAYDWQNVTAANSTNTSLERVFFDDSIDPFPVSHGQWSPNTKWMVDERICSDWASSAWVPQGVGRQCMNDLPKNTEYLCTNTPKVSI